MSSTGDQQHELYCCIFWGGGLDVDYHGVGAVLVLLFKCNSSDLLFGCNFIGTIRGHPLDTMASITYINCSYALQGTVFLCFSLWQGIRYAIGTELSRRTLS